MPCRLCQTSRQGDRVGDYRRCRRCGAMVVEPYPDEAANAPFTGAEAAAGLDAADAARLPFLQRRLDLIEAELGGVPDGASLWEVGCGAGHLAASALARGWRVSAVELSSELAELARRRAPAAGIVTGDALTTDHVPRDCHAVIALDVIEHVIDPALLLRRCRAALGDGGLLLLQTPNTDGLRRRTQGAGWDMLDPAQHLQLFSRRALTGLLIQEGFTVEWMRTISGSGHERGVAAGLARVKEAVLDRFGLGNGLLALARRRD